MWNRLKDLKKQHMMPLNKGKYKQMQHNLIEIYQSGKGHTVISKALGLQWTRNTGEPSKDWLANQNSSKGFSMTPQGGRKRTQTNI